MNLRFNLMKIRVLVLCMVASSLLFSCKKDDVNDPPIFVEPETVGFYVCCEGGWNQNNGSLFYYDMENGQSYKNYFETQNLRGLGDTPNDMKIYGSKVYCVVSGSNIVEVINASNAVSIRQISLTADDGNGRQPRQIAFHRDKAYVCCFDGTVVRIDTATLAVDAIVTCGRNPDGICVANGKLYVSNSGGLDFGNPDNTVSVVDIESFTEIKRITVVANPGKIIADSEGDLYLISRGDYMTIPSAFQRINGKTDEVQVFEHLAPANFTISGSMAYLYDYDYVTGASWFKVFDCKMKQVVNESFISDGTVIVAPYSINVNPLNGNVYITDAHDFFSVQGDIYCFNKEGQQKFKIENIGLNPNATVFLSKE
ncbi:MAG: YncE family protein [Bacteroidales bacterium]|nr:YncE family protein [Bacteroidales bacterium]